MAGDDVAEPPRSSPTESGGEVQALRRGAVGFGGVLFQSITWMAPAIATAISIPAGIPFGGGAMPLAVVFALIASLFVANSIAQLARHLPSAGSFYTYVSNALHPGLGFLVAWMFNLAVVIGGVFLAVQIGFIVNGTLHVEYGVPQNLWWIWMVLGSLLVFTLGYLGIRTSTGVGEVLGAFEILIFLALSITLIAKAGSHNTLQVFTTHFANNPKYPGLSGVFAASIFSILAFIGFEEAAPLAEEARNPRRAVPLAVLISCLAIGVFYVINTYASAVYFGPGRMLSFVNPTETNPWQDILARHAWGGVGFLLVFLALVNSAVANYNGSNNSSTRTMYAMGRIRLLPRAYANLTGTHRSPIVGLVTQLIVTISVSLWLGFQYSPYTAFALTATIIVDVFTPLFILLNIACLVYYARFRRAEFNWLLHGLLPVLGVVAFIPAFFAGAGVPVFSFITALPKPLSYAGPVVGIWLVIGIVYLGYLYARHPQRIADTRQIFVED